MLQTLIKDITKKYNVDKEFVIYLLNEYFKRNKSIDITKKKECKKIVKEIRTILYRLIGQYCSKRGQISALERRNFYNVVYQRIFSITGNPSSILDIGCGENPLYYNGNAKYYAYDIDNKSLEKVARYFKTSKIKGMVFKINLFEFRKFRRAYIAFLLKVLDLVDFKGHKNAEDILRSLKVNWVVVSFATRTLSGRKMNYPKRGWFERMLDRMGWDYHKVYYPGELFYIIKK